MYFHRAKSLLTKLIDVAATLLLLMLVLFSCLVSHCRLSRPELGLLLSGRNQCRDDSSTAKFSIRDIIFMNSAITTSSDLNDIFHVLEKEYNQLKGQTQNQRRQKKLLKLKKELQLQIWHSQAKKY